MINFDSTANQRILMNISGKIIEIFETQQITDTFKKREFVIEVAENPSYPEYIKFEMIQDRIEMLTPFKVGDEVTISFNLKGRKWTDPGGNTKYFNTLQAWRIEESGTPASDNGGSEAAGTHPPDWINGQDETDNLPF